MNRRHFMISTTAISLLPAAAFAYSPLDYTPALWRELRKSDETVILYFRASWSLTCQRKQALLTELLAQNPDYAALTYVDVNWDFFGPAQMTERLKVTRHSTLLVTKQGKEIARLEDTPDRDKLQAFLDQALSA